MKVIPKKHLGQHFLLDQSIAERIAELVPYHEDQIILEVGPGTGILTTWLKKRFPKNFMAVEVDRQSISYLIENEILTKNEIIQQDFLTLDLERLSGGKAIHIVGNFPYHISSQIVFHSIDYKQRVVGLTGMFQKEVAQRLAAHAGSKIYGIISILSRLWYDCEYHFTVGPEVFEPPPNVFSGVIQMNRNDRNSISVPESDFAKLVKTAFNQRRKTLKNSLKSSYDIMLLPEHFTGKRPEQLSEEDFLRLAESMLI